MLAFKKFDDIAEALAASTALIEGKLDKSLQKFLKKHIVKAELKDSLGVVDSKLGGLIKETLSIKCKHNDTCMEIIRGIRQQLDNLIPQMNKEQLHAMTLGLAHSLGRYKLKFSADQVDTMIIQAISLLDEMDKEINTFAMRIKEWYGWHFPEMQKIVLDNLQYAKVILKMGIRKNANELDFSDILESGVEEEMKSTAIISMGTDINDEDLHSIKKLCIEVIEMSEYRSKLYEYLENRMNSIAPNLSMMVGELVGARLIAHAGSLLNLAKYPASTVQILGAEKALFRALKTKSETPKYGLIYHASLIGQAPTKIKGKISRILAAKTALSIRVDALGESVGPTIAVTGKQKVEDTLRQYENNGGNVGNAGGNKGKSDYNKGVKRPLGGYNADGDVKLNKKIKFE